MASKWINTKLFDNYVAEKEKETSENTAGMKRSDFVWKSPTAGTVDKAKVYEGRFIPDKKGNFTKKYLYHMWKSGEKWIFHVCPKTDGLENFCPICSAVNVLYQGTNEDKKTAYQMKRKERHVGNFFVVNDPRDNEIDDETKKSNGKVKIYEFPSKLESKLKNELVDKNEGLGVSIFDPGKDGHNVIIKIKATKPDKNNKSWPDYSDSIFSRKSSPLGENDNEIKKIMESTHVIDEYINNMKSSPEDTLKMLKEEMLYGLIEKEWIKHFGMPADGGVGTERSVSTNKTNDQPDDVPEPTETTETDDLSADDLMAELRAMK